MSQPQSLRDTDPLVTVVIPTYNGARLVARAVTSVINQTYQRLEVVVVDDGSTDDTEQVIRAIPDTRVRYLRHEVNKGVSASRNIGIRSARGALIAFLDSDDEWLPDKTRRQVDRMSQLPSDTGLVYGACLVLDQATGRVLRIVSASRRGDVLRDLLFKDFVMSPTPLVRRECFDKAGFFDENFKTSEDWDVWLRIAEHYRFDYVKEPVAKYYLSSHQVTGRLSVVVEGHLKFIDKHAALIRAEPAILAHHYKVLGQLSVMHRNSRMANTYFRQAIRTNPRSPSLYLHMVAARLAPTLYVNLGRWLNIQLEWVRHKWP